MTSKGRTDVTSAEALAIHRAAQRVAKDGTGPPHDEVACWDCCFMCDFDHSAVITNDKAIGVQSVYK